MQKVLILITIAVTLWTGFIHLYVPNLVGKTTPLFWPVNTTVLANNSKITQTQGY